MKKSEREGYRRDDNLGKKDFKRNDLRQTIEILNLALLDGLKMLAWIFYVLLALVVIAAAGLVGIVVYWIL